MRVTLKPSKAARRALARGHRVRDRVSVRFTAKGKGATTVASKVVRLRR